MLLFQWGLSSLGFCSVSSDVFFVFSFYLSLVLAIDFCNSQLIFFCIYLISKRHKDKKRLNILKKMNSLKKVEGVPLLNFEGGPGVPLLNFRGSRVPLLNFEGRPGVLVPLLHHAVLYCLNILTQLFAYVLQNCCS